MSRPEQEFSGDRLRGHRHGAGHTLTDVATEAGCAVGELESYEAGRTEPTPTTLAALASVLRVPINELYTQHDAGSSDYASAVVQHADPLNEHDLRALTLIMRSKAS